MDHMRVQIKKLSERQRSDVSWLELAALLKQAREEKLFKEWQFKSFSAYCTAELWFGKRVASDMVNARIFIEEHFPDPVSVMTDKTTFVPGYNEISILRRVKDRIPSEEFDGLKSALFKGTLSRDNLKAKISFLMPSKKKRLESVKDLKAQILKLEARIHVLETQIKFGSKNGNLKGFTPERIKKLYRGISFSVHPDRGGDPELMKEVNVFFESLIK